MHSHKTHNLVKTTLKKIAENNKLPYPKVKRLFVFEANPSITHQFWKELANANPLHGYTDVYHCPGCGQFDLE